MTLRDAYAKLRDTEAELRRLHDAIEEMTLSPELFDFYDGTNSFGEEEMYIISKASIPFADGNMCPAPELEAHYTRRQWSVEDNVAGVVHVGDATSLTDAKRQVVLAMADYCMRKEKT